MDNTDNRWKQRFNQFNKAFSLLKSAIAIEQPTVIKRAGLIHFFEMAFELGWKLLKDHQEVEGFVINSPRNAIKQAFQSQIIQAGHSWINAGGLQPEVEQLVLFGSRTKGTYKSGSDVDLAIKGAAVTYDTVRNLADLLNEQKPHPYFFDVIDYQSIQEPELIKHINKVGIAIFNRSDT